MITDQVKPFGSHFKQPWLVYCVLRLIQKKVAQWTFITASILAKTSRVNTGFPNDNNRGSVQVKQTCSAALVRAGSWVLPSQM